MKTFNFELYGHKFVFRTLKHPEDIRLRAASASHGYLVSGVVGPDPNYPASSGRMIRIPASFESIMEATQKLAEQWTKIALDCVISIDGRTEAAAKALEELFDEGEDINIDSLWPWIRRKGAPPATEKADPKGSSESKENASSNGNESASSQGTPDSSLATP